MPFNLLSAREDKYTDEEIYNFLAPKLSHLNLQSALDDQYTTTEVLDYLNSKGHLDQLEPQNEQGATEGPQDTTEAPVAEGVPEVQEQSQTPVAPPQDDPHGYLGLIDKYAKERDVNPLYLRAQLVQESGGDKDAVSPKDARGLMQIIDSTAKEIAAELGEKYVHGMQHDPETGIRFATHYNKKHLERFGNDVRFAAVAYHSGPGGAQQVWEHYQKTGEFKVPRTKRYWDGHKYTADYVDDILVRMQKMQAQQTVPIEDRIVHEEQVDEQVRQSPNYSKIEKALISFGTGVTGLVGGVVEGIGRIVPERADFEDAANELKAKVARGEKTNLLEKIALAKHKHTNKVFGLFDGRDIINLGREIEDLIPEDLRNVAAKAQSGSMMLNKELDNGEEVLTTWSSMVAGQGGMLGLTALNAPVAMFSMSVFEGNNYMRSAELLGIPTEVAKKYAIPVGVGSGAVEYAQQLGRIKALKGAVPLMQKFISTNTPKLVRMMGEAAFEGVEEGVQGYIQYVGLKAAIADMKKENPDWNPSGQAPEYGWDQWWREFSAGAGIGALFQTIGLGMGKANTLVSRRKATIEEVRQAKKRQSSQNQKAQFEAKTGEKIGPYANEDSAKEYVKDFPNASSYDDLLTAEELAEVNTLRGTSKETVEVADTKDAVAPGEKITVDGTDYTVDSITDDGQVMATTTETVKEGETEEERQRTVMWNNFVNQFRRETGEPPMQAEGETVETDNVPVSEQDQTQVKKTFSSVPIAEQDATDKVRQGKEEVVETFGVTDENLKKAQDIVVGRLDDVEVVGVQEGFMVDGEVRHEPRLMFNFIGEGKNKGQTFDLPLTATQADIDAEIGKKVEIRKDAPESPVEAPQGAVKSEGTQSTREVVKAPVSPPSTPQSQIEETTEVTPEQTDEVSEKEDVPEKVQKLPTSEDDATITISKIIDTLGNKITKERYTDTTNEELTEILKKQFPSATETIENTPDFSEQFKEAAILKRVKVELSKETKAQTKQGVHTRGRQSKFVTGTDEQILNSLIKRFPEAEELMRSIPDFTNKIRTLAQTKTLPKKITQKAKEALLPEVIETTKETKDSEDITTQTAKDQQSEQQEIDKSEKKQQVVVEQLRPVADESVVPYDAKKHDKLLEQFYDRVSKRKVSYLERVGDTDFVQLTPHGEKYFQDRKDRVGDKIVRGEQAHDIIDRAQYQEQDNVDADEEMEIYDLDSEQFDSGERFEDNSTNVSEEEGTTQTQKFHNSIIKQLPLGSAIRIFTEETTIAPSGKVLNDFSKQGDGAKGAVLMSADKKQALVFIRPSANSLREAVTAIHEMWGHFGKRKVFKAFPAIAKKWEEVFESDRGSDFMKKLEHDYTPKKAEIRKSLEKAGIYTEATLNEKFEDLLFEEWTARRIGEVGSKFFDKKGNIVESRIADKQNVLVRVYEAIKEYLHSVFGTGISDTQLTQMTRELVSTMPNVSVNETLEQMKQHYATTRESVAQKEASKPKTALQKQITKHLESINKKINNKEEFAELSNPEQNELHGQQNILNRLAAQGSDQSIVGRAQAELRKANDTIKKHEDTLKTGRMTHPAEAGVVDDTTMEELYGQVDVLNKILKGDVAKAQKLPTTESSEASEVSFQDTEQQSKLSDEESVFEIIASAEQAQDKKFAQAQLVKFARKVLTNADIRKDFLTTVVNIESLESPTFDRAISRAYSLAEAGKKKRSITKLQNIIKKDLNTKSMSHLSKIHKGLIKQLLGQFDIKKLSSKKRTELIRKELELVDVDPELVDEGIKNEIARLDKTPLSDLDLNEIENITKQIQGILFVDKVQKDLISFERKATIEEETAKTQGAIKKYVSSKKGDKKLRTLANIDGEIGKITYNDLTKKSQGAAARTANWYKYYASDIQTIANELDGWEAGDITKILYTEINDGYSKMLEMNQLRSGFFKQRLLGAVKNLDKYSASFVTSFDRLAAKVTGKDVLELTETTMGNRKIELTHDQRIAMYLGSLNQDNLRHMINGGLYVGNIVDPIKVSLRDIKELRNSLTKEERLIAETIHEYLNVHQRKAINEVSNKKDGYDIADVDNYFPMQSKYTDVEKVRPDINKPSDMATMYRYGVSPENVGVLKTRTQASTPLVLEGAFEAVMRTSNLTNKYIGMAIPLRNATAVYNSGLKRTMMDNGLEQQTKEIDYYLEQLYGGRFLDQETKVAGKLFNMFVVGKLAGRMFPSLKQVASIPVLWTEIDVKYYNPLDLAQYKRVWRDIEANSPELFTRRSAGFSREFGELMKSAQARKDVTGKKSFTDMAMMPITFMDSIAIASAWTMSEREISATTNLKKGSEEYTQAVRRRAEEVVSKTQPTYHMTQRPQLMGNHPIKKIINMFGTQRNKNFQMTRRAFGEIGKGNISKGVSSLVYIYGLQAASVMLIDNLRAFMLGKIDSDDEDPWWKKTMGELLGNALGNFIGIDRVVKVLLGNRYSATIDIPGLEALAEIHGAVKAATEITGGTKTTTRGGRKRTKRLKSSEIAKKQQAVVKHVLKAASSVGAPGLAVSEFIDATNVALKEFE